LPRALGYSIALIDDFFDPLLNKTRFTLRAAWEIDPSLSSADSGAIVNSLPSGEEMDGRFELHCGGPDGRLQKQATWTLRVPSGGHSQVVQLPVLPYEPNVLCWLSFRGRVGQDSDVVAFSTGPNYWAMAPAPLPPPPICIPFCD
jgi:hypothetical protein